jgi:hypothetical protein
VVPTSITIASSHMMPPLNRGNGTVTAHARLDTSSTATMLPPASARDSPPRTTSSTHATASQAAIPGATDNARCMAAIRRRPAPPVNSRS